MGEMTEGRVEYTSAAVTENHKITSAEATDKYVELKPLWGPVMGVKKVRVGDVDYKIVDAKATPGAGEVAVEISPSDQLSVGFTFSDTIAADAELSFGYLYDNVVIPQNDIPQYTAHMEGIALHAKARRIAVYYSQMAAFQAKTEMGIDLGEVLATQACAELSYEIDSEIVKMLSDNATEYTDLVWNKRLPVGVGKRDWYAGFAETVETGSQHIYDKTQKHAANYMIISSSVKPILVLMDGWKPVSSAKMNGPYFAGELNGIKVYVSPAMKPGRFVLGYNGGDMVTSAAVYAPYMAIVPTQLLGFADGAMSQGFSTLYDLKMLNACLLVAGQVVDKPFTSGYIVDGDPA